MCGLKSVLMWGGWKNKQEVEGDGAYVLGSQHTVHSTQSDSVQRVALRYEGNSSNGLSVAHCRKFNFVVVISCSHAVILLYDRIRR